MPDNNMMGFHWVVVCYFKGRIEKVEADDDGIVGYLRDLLSNPRKTHPDIEEKLTHVRIYKRVADIPIANRYVKGRFIEIEDMLKSLHVDDRAAEETSWVE